MTRVSVKNQAGEVLGSIEAEANTVLLKQLEAAGIEIPNACKAGMCAACMCHIESWSDAVVKDFRWEPAFPLWDDEVMTCIWSVLDTDNEVILKTLY